MLLHPLDINVSLPRALCSAVRCSEQFLRGITPQLLSTFDSNSQHSLSMAATAAHCEQLELSAAQLGSQLVIEVVGMLESAAQTSLEHATSLPWTSFK